MLKRLMSMAAILLLIICSICASETVSQEIDPDFLTHSLLIADMHRTLFLDEISEVPKERLVLFTLGPGGGGFYGQYAEAIKMQKVPTYFFNLAEGFNPSYRVYYDLGSLDVKVDVTDGNFHIF